jgi:hypothetical protein
MLSFACTFAAIGCAIAAALIIRKGVDTDDRITCWVTLFLFTCIVERIVKRQPVMNWADAIFIVLLNAILGALAYTVVKSVARPLGFACIAVAAALIKSIL